MGVPTRITRRMRLLLLPAVLAGLAMAVALATPNVDAEENLQTLKTLQKERRSFASTVSPAVVAVSASEVDIARAATQQAGGGIMAASGFVVDGDYVVTCMESGQMMKQRDYLNPGDKVWMMAHDATQFSGKVVGRDKRNLLLLIKMDEGHPDLPSLKFADSDKAAMGSTACGFGNTLDSLLIDRQISMSYGVVSGFYRFEPIDVMDPENPNTGGDPYKGNVLEIDVAVHDGDHGGPVVNLDGEVIGMMCAHYMAGRHLGCAVPSNQIRAVLAQLKKGVPEDELAQGWLGFKAKKPARSRDIFISEVEEGGPAEAAGIKIGMQLVRVDNYQIPGWNRLREMLGVGYIVRERTIGGGMFGRQQTVEVPVSYGVPVGTHIQLTLRNPEDGTETTVDLIVGEKPEDF